MNNNYDYKLMILGPPKAQGRPRARNAGKFKREVLSGLSLTPREKKGAKSFLRAQFSANPPTIYYEQLVGELFKIASKLC